MKNTPEEAVCRIDAPAPWQLRGKGYICLLNRPKSDNKQQSNYSLMIFMDYSQSPVGPYYELLFIPGSFVFEDGHDHLSISQIFVSSMDSVINGRRNWGIPKQLAEFDVNYDDQGVDRVKVSRQGRVFAELSFRSGFLPIPFSTALLPKSWVTLAQKDKGLTFLYRPKASGLIRRAQLIAAEINSAEFPLVQLDQIKITLKITHLNMHFPVANIIH